MVLGSVEQGWGQGCNEGGKPLSNCLRSTISGENLSEQAHSMERHRGQRRVRVSEDGTGGGGSAPGRGERVASGVTVSGGWGREGGEARLRGPDLMGARSLLGSP